MKRKYFAFLLVLCLILSMPTAVLAAQEIRMIHRLQTKPNELSIILTNQEETGEYSATLGGKKITLTGGTVGQENVPITVYCLVDTSGTVSSQQLELIKGALTKINQSMSKNDQMYVVTVSDKESGVVPLNTKDERERAIAAISSSNKTASSFYAGIVNGLNRIASSTDMNPMRAMVIFSGCTEQILSKNSEYTEDQVRTAIEKERIPIYAVSPAQYYSHLKGNDLLDSFVRGACSGIHLTTVNADNSIISNVDWDATGETFGSTIWKDITNYKYLTANLSSLSLDSSDSEAKLTVTYTSSKNSYTDSMLVSTVGLLKPSKEPTEPTTSAPTEPTPTEDPDYSIYLYVGIGAGVLVLIAAIAAVSIISIRNAKRKAEYEAERRRAAEEAARRDAERAAHAQAWGNKAPEVQKPSQSKAACYVEIVDIPHGTHAKRFVVPFNEPVTFGRNKRAKYVLDETDTQLSSLHFSLIVQKDGLYVRDEQSTNGTYINGVTIVGAGWKKMQPGEKLRAGSREYRISVTDQKS